MRPVRLLIRDSAPPLSAHLEQRGDAHTHQHMRTQTQVHKAAGGHLSAGQIKAGKVNSSSTEACRSTRRGRKVFVKLRSFPSLFFFSCATLVRLCQHT